MVKKKLDNSITLDDLVLVDYLKKKESNFISEIELINEKIKELLNSGIPKIFSNYTLHNIEHSYRVIKYMGDIIPDISKLNDIEIAILILVGLLHDVGMAVSEEDIKLIKSDNHPKYEIKYSAVKKYIGGNDDCAIQEYVRRYHSQMSGDYIEKELSENFKISGNSSLSYIDDVIKICRSHTESFEWIKENLTSYKVVGDYEYNSQYISHLLRLGDILDIDEKRTPLSLYNLISPVGKSDEEWKQHFIIQNYDKIEKNPKSNLNQIVFHGKCSDATIHRKLLSYFDWVKEELVSALSTTNNMHEQYRLDFENNIVQNISTEGYTFSDYKMKLDFKAISSLLMGEKIYGSKELGLRELIQNSIDACRFRKEIETIGKDFGENDYQPLIKIVIDERSETVSIKDNGIGMSINVIKNHFLNIGKSYYNSSEFLLQDISYKPIGNFGIGFLACFMLSDNIKILTRYYDNPSKYTIELEQGNEFTSMLKSDDVWFDGTEVIFNYSEFMSVFKNKVEEISSFLKKFFITDGINIELIDVAKKERYPIKNNIEGSVILEKGIKIDLSEYLSDIEGYAVVKYNNSFIKQLEDISFSGDVYFYNVDEGLFQVDDLSSIQIDDYKVNNKINYYTIPIVNSSNEDDFLNGLNYTDNDVSEVIEKMDTDLEWISILIHKDSDIIMSEQEIEVGDYLFGDFCFNDLVELGHQETCKTKMFEIEQKIFEGKKNELYLPFKDEDDYHWRYLLRQSGKYELFLRNVLIKDYHFSIPTKASIIDVNVLKINVKSKKVIPDVSRNKINDKTERKLNYAISKAIHIAISKNEKLSDTERNTLELFIDNYYKEKTEFEK